MNSDEVYYHDHGDGVFHSHIHADEEHDLSHESTHNHSHGHTHTQTKVVINRLARAIGHLEHVKHMVEEGKDCSEVLVQLAAVRSALNSTAKIIIKDHIEHCIAHADGGGEESLKELNEAIDKFI